jgi:hypothetical protein
MPLAARSMYNDFVIRIKDTSCTAGTATHDLRIFALMCVILLPVLIVPFNEPIIVHHLPYILVLGILAGALTLIRETPDKFSRYAILLHAVNLTVVWFFGAWTTWHLMALR